MKKRLLASALIAAMSFAGVASAQEAAAEEPAFDPNPGALTFSGGVDLTTAYFFRGYNQEDSGVIVQPYGSIAFDLYKTDDFAVGASVGVWNSIHENKSGGDDAFYETDLIGTVYTSYMGFTFTGIYTLYYYPSDVFEDVQEVGVIVGYDDSSFWKDNTPLKGFALKPSLGFFFETRDENGTEDTYAEFKVAPSYALDLEQYGVPFLADAALSFPITVGFSVDDYYLDSDGDNEPLGYVSAGVKLDVPLPIPAKYGAWTATGRLDYLYLNADSAEVTNDGGDNDELIGTVGVSVAY